MTTGMKITQSNGYVVDFSTAAGSFVDMFEVAAGSSGERDYPALAGYEIFCTMMAVNAAAIRMHNTAVSYSKGYPTVTYFPFSGPSNVSATLVMVCVK